MTNLRKSEQTELTFLNVNFVEKAEDKEHKGCIMKLSGGIWKKGKHQFLSVGKSSHMDTLSRPVVISL